MSYNPKFIEGQNIEIPSISKDELLLFNNYDKKIKDYYLNYYNYSVLHNPFRKLPYFSAANIDGSLFKKLGRIGYWSNDAEIIDQEQFKDNFYEKLNSTPNSNKRANGAGVIDRGHMTKREDVQWGKTTKIARYNAKSTFVYTNAVPQHYRLNQTIWRFIEDYILHKETVLYKLKISVFTGPVLSEDDPYPIALLDSPNVKIPILFWKVLYYINNNDDLFRTAFITNHSNLLVRDKIIEDISRDFKEKMKPSDLTFQQFKDAETYQVNVSLIEKLTSLKFTEAKELLSDNRVEKLILKDVQVRSDKVFKSTSVSNLSNNIINLRL